MRYRIMDFKNGYIVEADTLKDILEFMAEYNVSDEDIKIEYINS